MIYKKTLKLLALAVVLLGFFFTGWFAHDFLTTSDSTQLTAPIINRLRPLEKYSFENLMSKKVLPGKFSKGAILKDNEDYQSGIFFLEFDPTLEGKETKKISGLFNTPKKRGEYPLVLMFRGYIDQSIYTSGMGTQRAGEFFTQNGYITIAPDFLGYATSDKESGNIFESRFQTYTTALTLLKTIDDSSLKQITNDMWDGKNVFIWGHSNGGQIALTTLELSGTQHPTTLWAPVTKPFPYSVLYYTDQSDDGGKLIRQELAKFEADYDVEKYSLTNYFDKINAPIQFHQGSADELVPISWTNTTVGLLEKIDKGVTYYKYPGADHNLQPSWNTVVTRDLEFFNEHRS